MEERKMKGSRARLDYILKHNYYAYYTYDKVVSFFIRLWGLFVPMNRKMVLFTAHTRKYNDSPKVIYEEMIQMPEFKDFIYIWGLEDPDNVEIPGPAIKVKSDSLEYFKKTLQAKFWITCVNIERNLHFKKKKCIYLNTWHGAPFKHAGNDAGNHIYNLSSVDYFCCEGEYDRQILQKAFNLNPKTMVCTGIPRNDILYHAKDIDKIKIRKRLGISNDIKVILYAPTWRESDDHGASCSICPPINIDYWKEKLGEDYIVLFRTHAYTNKLMGIEFDDFIKDYSSYPDVNDLLIISDVLISDYSSIMIDFSILERPIICFGYDYDKYKGDRGFYPSFENDIPSGVLRSEREVITYLMKMDVQEEIDKTKKFKAKYSCYGGNATKDCISLMFKDILT